jgi:hypothetical protein
VHYLWLPHVARIYSMYVYGKNETATLSRPQKVALQGVVQAIKQALTKEGR